MEQLPKVTKVEARPNMMLKVTFQVDKKIVNRTIRLSGFIARYAGLATLKDAEAFKKAKIIDWGAAIGWPGNIDIGSSTLWRVAREQMPFANAQFKAWQNRMNLSNQEAADALGLSLTTIKNIRTGHVAVSNALAIACRAMEAEPVTLAAHYFPRKAGRPKAA